MIINDRKSFTNWVIGEIKFGGKDNPTEGDVAKLNPDFEGKSSTDIFQMSKEQIEKLKTMKHAEFSSVDLETVFQGTPHFLTELEGKRSVDEIHKSRISQEELDKYLYSYHGEQAEAYSHILLESGFFDGMSKEKATEVYQLLLDINRGVSQPEMPTGDPSAALSNKELVLETISAAAALKSFSDKFLTGKTKEEFDFVTKKFFEFNMETTKHYVTAQDIRETKASMEPYNMSEEAKAGSIRPNESEIRENNTKLASIFKKIQNSGDVKGTMKEIMEQDLSFYSNNSKYEPLKNYLKGNSKETFARMEDYWTRLENLEI